MNVESPFKEEDRLQLRWKPILLSHSQFTTICPMSTILYLGHTNHKLKQYIMRYVKMKLTSIWCLWIDGSILQLTSQKDLEAIRIILISVTNFFLFRAWALFSSCLLAYLYHVNYHWLKLVIDMDYF